MTGSERRTIGLDRPIRIEWLDAVAGQLAAGASIKEVREYVWTLLDGVVAGKTAQSARGKTLTVLSRVWLTPPAAAVPLRDSALRLIGAASPEERLAIHWAMLAASYPFFVDAATNVGKALALNGDITLSQLMRRLVPVWGDRSTLHPAAQRLMRSLVKWGALQDGPQPGRFLAAQKKVAVSSGAAELLLEGLLVTAGRAMPLSQLVVHPATFPFDMRPDITALRRSERFRMHRQGDQTDQIERHGRGNSKHST